VDGLRPGREAPGGEFAQGRPQQPVLVGGAQVVGRAAAEKKAGDLEEGGVEGLGADVGRGRPGNRSRQLVPGGEGPGLAGLGRRPAGLGPGQPVGL